MGCGATAAFRGAKAPLTIGSAKSGILIFMCHKRDCMLRVPRPFTRLATSVSLLTRCDIAPTVNSAVSRVDGLDVAFSHDVAIGNAGATMAVGSRDKAAGCATMDFGRGTNSAGAISVAFHDTALRGKGGCCIIVRTKDVTMTKSRRHVGGRVGVRCAKHATGPIR